MGSGQVLYFFLGTFFITGIQIILYGYFNIGIINDNFKGVFVFICFKYIIKWIAMGVFDYNFLYIDINDDLVELHG